MDLVVGVMHGSNACGAQCHSASKVPVIGTSAWLCWLLQACKDPLLLQVATLEAAVTYLQQLLPGRAMTRGGGYRDPELLRALSMDRTKSGMLV